MGNTTSYTDHAAEDRDAQAIRDRAKAELASYIGGLTRERLLTAGEELELSRKIQLGDLKARSKLIESNMRLVINIAKCYHIALIPFEDLVQEGAIGLMTAAERFDPAKGYRFSTYATYWIKQSVSRAIDNKSRAIRVPAHVSESLRKLERFRGSYLREFGEEPTEDWLAAQMGVSVSKVTSLFQAAQDPLSLDMFVGEEAHTTLASLLGDKTAADPESEVMRREVRRELRQVLNALTERERTVMNRRLGLDEEMCVLQDIGVELHLSRERVRQIENQAIKKLRKMCPQLRDYLMD